MKTDIEKFIELYKSFGINCVVESRGYNKTITFCANSMFPDHVQTIHKNIQGSYDSYVEVTFDNEGRFENMSINYLE